MTTTQTAQVNDTTAKATKAPKAAKTALILALPVIAGNDTVKGSNGRESLLSLDCSNVSKSIGALLETVKAGTTFRAFGNTITMPKNGDFSARFNNLLEQLFNASFASKNNDEMPKADAVAFLEAVKATKKVDYPTLSRYDVMRGLAIRKAHYNAGLKSRRLDCDSTKINSVLITETKTEKLLHKAFKEGGRKAVIALREELGVKSIGWNG